MFGTLQQGNSPVRTRGEATASGDRWIEDVWSKGKAVNAPALPSHREFADILQQTYDNPYKSSRPEDKVGDAWLTSRGKGPVPNAVGKPSPNNLVLIGLLYKAYPDGCQHRFTNPAEAKALPRQGASALVLA